MMRDCQHGTPGCDCYQSGYAAGKDKAHFEIWTITQDHDVLQCGCEPCKTMRAVMARVSMTIQHI